MYIYQFFSFFFLFLNSFILSVYGEPCWYSQYQNYHLLCLYYCITHSMPSSMSCHLLLTLLTRYWHDDSFNVTVSPFKMKNIFNFLLVYSLSSQVAIHYISVSASLFRRHSRKKALSISNPSRDTHPSSLSHQGRDLLPLSLSSLAVQRRIKFQTLPSTQDLVL